MLFAISSIRKLTSVDCAPVAAVRKRVMVRHRAMVGSPPVKSSGMKNSTMCTGGIVMRMDGKPYSRSNATPGNANVVSNCQPPPKPRNRPGTSTTLKRGCG